MGKKQDEIFGYSFCVQGGIEAMGRAIRQIGDELGGGAGKSSQT